MLIVHLRPEEIRRRNPDREHPVHGRGARPLGTVEDVPEAEAAELIERGHAIAAAPPSAVSALPAPAEGGETFADYWRRCGLFLPHQAGPWLWPSGWTLAAWQDDAPTDSPRFAQGRRLRVIPSSYLQDDPGAHFRREWDERADAVRHAHAARRRERLAGELFDRLRRGEWHVVGQPLTAEHATPRPIESFRWSQPFMALVRVRSGTALQPIPKKGEPPAPSDAPTFTLLTLHPAPAPAKPRPSKESPMEDGAIATPLDPLLLRYGIPLARARRHLARPELLRQALRPVVSERDVDAPVARWGAADENPWGREDRDNAQRNARAKLMDDAPKAASDAITRELWQRLASGELVAWGQRGSVADPFTRIEPHAWPHLLPADWPAGMVQGGGAVFHGVRIMAPAGLPLEVAARAVAAQDDAQEAEELEAAGYAGEPGWAGLLPEAKPRPSPYDEAADRRLAELHEGMRANLLEQLGAGRLVAEGLFLRDGPAMQPRAITAAAWREPERVRVEWPESSCIWSPDHRPLSLCYDHEEVHVRDVRIMLGNTAQPAPIAEPPQVGATTGGARVDAVPTDAPAKGPRLSYAALVAHLRSFAKASPNYRTHDRAALRAMVKGKTTDKEFRAALKEAFEDFAKWQRTGRRPDR